MTSLPRLLSDHTPILWSTQVVLSWPTYFKMDRLWLRDGGFKRDIAKWWHSHLNFGSTSDRLITKLKDLRHHLFNLRRQIWTAQTRNRDTPLARFLTLDAMEDLRPLMSKETRERKTCLDEVAKVDLKIEMECHQRSQQL